MKIGVLTFHRCINYGSYGQAGCMAEGLRAGVAAGLCIGRRLRGRDIVGRMLAQPDVRSAASPASQA